MPVPESSSVWAESSSSAWGEAPYPIPSGTATKASATGVAAASGSAAWSAWNGASTTGPAIAKWTGAASKVNVGAGLAGIAGVAAFLL